MADAELEARINLDVSALQNAANTAEQALRGVVNASSMLEASQQSAQTALNDQQKSLLETAKAAGYYFDAAGRLHQANGTLASQSDELGQKLKALQSELGRSSEALSSVTRNTNAAASTANSSGLSFKGFGISAAGGIGAAAAAATAGAAAIAALGAAAASLGAGAFIALGNEAQKASDILNQAQSLNIDTDNLQAAQYAVESIGMPADKLNDILKDINDKFGEFTNFESGEMKDAFDRLGIDAAKFIGLDPIEILKSVNAEAQKLSTSERTQLFEAMGDDLSLLQPLLADNGAEFERLTQQAKDFGLVTQNAALNDFDYYNKSLVRASSLIDGLSKQILADLAEPMANLVEFAKGFIDQLGGSEAVAKMVSEALIAGLEFAVEAGGWLAKRFSDVYGIAEGIKGTVLLIARGLLEAAEMMMDLPLFKAFEKIAGIDMTVGIKAAQSELDTAISKAKTFDQAMMDAADRSAKIDQFTDGALNAMQNGGRVNRTQRQYGNDEAGAANSLANYEANKAKEKAEKAAKEQEKRNKELLKEQEMLQKEQERMIMQEAKLADEAAKEQQQAAEKMAKATDKFDKTVNAESQRTSELELINPQMSFIGPRNPNLLSESELLRQRKTTAANGVTGDKSGKSEIVLTLMTLDGIKKSFPVLADVSTTESLKGFVNSRISNFFAQGAASRA